MKIIAICNKHLKTIFQKIDVKTFLLDGETIHTALLNAPDIDYKKYFKEKDLADFFNGSFSNERFGKVIMHYQ